MNSYFFGKYLLPAVFSGCELGIGFETISKPNYDLPVIESTKPEGRIISLAQVHSDRIILVESEKDIQAAKNSEADGIITTIRDVWLLIRTADCIPLFMFYPKEPVLAAVHVGWRGLAKGIVKNAIEILKTRYKIEFHDIRAFLGPAICQKHYEVKPDVARLFNEKFLDKDGGRLFLDLKLGVKYEIIAAGANEKYIFDIRACTYERDYLPSYRKNGANLRGEIENFGRLF